MHSIVSQGKVEAVLASKPEERRELVEEAAGLGKFKRRRHRAELKLARVGIQVERAKDVEAEVRKRLRPLALQATAAERAEKLVDEIAGLRARIAQLDLEAADARREAAEERKTAAGIGRRSAQEKLQALLDGAASGRGRARRRGRAGARRRSRRSTGCRARPSGSRCGRRAPRAARRGCEPISATPRRAADATHDETSQLERSALEHGGRASRCSGGAGAERARAAQRAPRRTSARRRRGEERLERSRERRASRPRSPARPEDAKARTPRLSRSGRRSGSGCARSRRRCASASAELAEAQAARAPARRPSSRRRQRGDRGCPHRRARTRRRRGAGGARTERLDALERSLAEREGIPPAARAFADEGETLALSLLDVEPGKERAVAAALAWRASAVVADDPAAGLALLERARDAGLGSLAVLVGTSPSDRVAELPVVAARRAALRACPVGDRRGVRLRPAARRALVRGRDGRGGPARARDASARARGRGRPRCSAKARGSAKQHAASGRPSAATTPLRPRRTPQRCASAAAERARPTLAAAELARVGGLEHEARLRVRARERAAPPPRSWSAPVSAAKGRSGCCRWTRSERGQVERDARDLTEAAEQLAARSGRSGRRREDGDPRLAPTGRTRAERSTPTCSGAC